MYGNITLTALKMHIKPHIPFSFILKQGNFVHDVMIQGKLNFKNVLNLNNVLKYNQNVTHNYYYSLY